MTAILIFDVLNRNFTQDFIRLISVFCKRGN